MPSRSNRARLRLLAIVSLALFFLVLVGIFASLASGTHHTAGTAAAAMFLVLLPIFLYGLLPALGLQSFHSAPPSLQSAGRRLQALQFQLPPPRQA
jgi:hypothetical protein